MKKMLWGGLMEGGGGARKQIAHIVCLSTPKLVNVNNKLQQELESISSGFSDSKMVETLYMCFV